MRLKYYLRGLGIGIIVTTLVLGVGYKKENKVTDSIEAVGNEDNLTDKLSTKSSDINSEDKTYIKTDHINNIEENSNNLPAIYGSEQENSEAVIQSEEEVNEEELNEKDLQTKQDNGTLIQGEIIDDTDNKEESDTIVSGSSNDIPKEVQQLLNQNDVFVLDVVKGDDSGTVSRKLYNAGLIDNASQFDAFLTQHGYDKKINVGEKRIPKGSSWMEIAQKLAGK